MKRAAVLLAAVAAACSPAPDGAEVTAASQAPVSAAPPPAAPAPAPAPATLAGEWRVAGIDGQDFDEPYGLALSANATQIWWEPRCAGVVRDYAITAGGIRFSAPPPLPAPDPAVKAMPRPVCTIAPPPRLADVVRALDAARTVVRTPSNGIAIAGGGHDLLLFSQ